MIMSNPTPTQHPQIKICGLTRPETAAACAVAGADAIGLVFYPPSPRFVSADLARRIREALPPETAAVGVFVNVSLVAILEKVHACRLSAVQLHGQEPPELGAQLAEQQVRVIRGLYLNGTPPISDADRYPADAYLVECRAGKLPGGNAQVWDWGAARQLAARRPVVLAGGLDPENVARAIRAARPAAVDVSSGVEQVPGEKDVYKVKAFIAAVRGCRGTQPVVPIFSET
jgi:phosphoribosylanthranilate isomerase